jgi:hypothetical protein
LTLVKTRDTSGVVRLLRDSPEFGCLAPHTLRVLAWCYRYTEITPSRDEIMRAMTALASHTGMTA